MYTGQLLNYSDFIILNTDLNKGKQNTRCNHFKIPHPNFLNISYLHSFLFSQIINLKTCYTIEKKKETFEHCAYVTPQIKEFVSG